MKRPSVRPICPLQQRGQMGQTDGRTLQQHAAGLLLWARRVGNIDRLLLGWRRRSTGRSTARSSKRGNATFTADVGS